MRRSQAGLANNGYAAVEGRMKRLRSVGRTRNGSALSTPRGWRLADPRARELTATTVRSGAEDAHSTGRFSAAGSGCPRIWSTTTVGEVYGFLSTARMTSPCSAIQTMFVVQADLGVQRAGWYRSLCWSSSLRVGVRLDAQAPQATPVIIRRWMATAVPAGSASVTRSES